MEGFAAEAYSRLTMLILLKATGSIFCCASWFLNTSTMGLNVGLRRFSSSLFKMLSFKEVSRDSSTNLSCHELEQCKIVLWLNHIKWPVFFPPGFFFFTLGILTLLQMVSDLATCRPQFAFQRLSLKVNTN